MKSQVDILMIARVIGNIFSVVGYVVLLHYDPLLGSCIKLTGMVLCTPFCIKLKLWDVALLFGFFGIIDLSNIIKILFY